MVNNKTVLVVGAGASVEFGLPTGNGLRHAIKNLLDIKFDSHDTLKSGDPLIVEALRSHVRQNGEQNINPYRQEAVRIANAIFQAISIDNFIDNHRDNIELELCAKLAICKAILKEEQKSDLYINKHSNARQLDYQKLEEKWVNKFFQILTENATLNEIEERLDSVAFIIFNYDRCVEHFLFMAFQNFYGVDAAKAAELVGQVEMYHPYGTVGGLPWQKTGCDIDFGGEPGSSQLLDLANNIRTFTESYTKSSAGQNYLIEGIIKNSSLMIYLGFAFHPQNMKFLFPRQLIMGSCTEHYATAFGMSDSNTNQIESDIRAAWNASILDPSFFVKVRNDLKCNELFSEYGRLLSLNNH